MSSRHYDPVGRAGWFLRRLFRQVWVRASLFSLGGVLSALLAAFAGSYIPYDPGLTLASGSVDDILTILASSMLAVTTFSLSIMVSAYTAATSNATPRATKLLRADGLAQNTLSTFVGAFLFSIVGIIGLSAGLYESQGRVLLFFATLVALLVVVFALLRWIEHLGRFGRVSDAIIRVEDATRTPLLAIARQPFGGGLAPVPVPAGAQPIPPPENGYVQHVDIDQLDDIATAEELTLYLDAIPGTLLHPARPLLHVQPAVSDEVAERLVECFSIGREREFDHDPRYGLAVLSEIASRALSPAVNDPGTAIEVTGAGLRLFLDFARARQEREPTGETCAQVHVKPLDPADLLFAFANPIARDGAAMLEVQERLLVVLAALAEAAPDLFGAEARNHARRILERAEGSMKSAGDRALLKGYAEPLLAGD